MVYSYTRMLLHASHAIFVAHFQKRDLNLLRLATTAE
jgi:hypothetical protein